MLAAPTNSMIDQEAIAAAYQELLLRDPEPSAVAALRKAPDAQWLHGELRTSVEFRTVVEPLRQLLVQEWEQWAFRAPTAAELRRGVTATRGRCGSDQAVQRALADGSIRTRLAFRPLKIEMDITNQCNLRCVMCHFSQPSYHAAPRQHITVEQFAAIADQAFHRAHQVSLSYGTEPLLHRHVEQLIAVLAQHEVPHTYLNTNGLLLRECIIEAMIGHRFSFLLVSVDAATAETYERIRIGGSFTRLRDNLELLRACKARHGADLPRLGLGFVIMRQNMAELPDFVEMAADLGAVSVNAMHMAAWERVGNAPMGANLEKERCNDCLAAASERAASVGITLVAPPPFDDAAPARPLVADTAQRGREYGLAAPVPAETCCPFPWGFAAIDPRGEVFPCGWWDNTKEPTMGNAFTTGFSAIWRGPKFQALRERLRAHRLEGPCAQCPAAGMGAPDAESAFRPT
jgi:radical SAM protein with 4Fe4S-binding SPASM domain